jgi:dienelactone hydrolase
MLGKRKLAVVAWGNGGCSADGASARLHLAEIASHGYLVIAPGAVLSGPGAPPAVERVRPQVDPVTGKLPPYPTKPADLTQAIDWALAENARPGSAFHGRIDSGKIAVAGHSCGGLQAMEAALDPRVKAAVIHNSGLFPDDVSPIRELRITKASLAGLRAPILYIVGGPTDNFTAFATDDFNRITAAPVMVASSPVGHHGTFREPNGGIAAAVATDWLDWQLFGDRTASKRFTGADCGLCGKADWTIMRKLERK